MTADHIDGPLHWERQGGRGRPVVFLHANPLDSSSWLYQTAHFSTWYDTVAVDLPGYGRSPRARAGLTMGDVATACWEAVDEVTADPAVVVGLSVGGWLAAHMARLRPSQVAALVVAGAGWFPDDDKAFARERMASYTEHGIAYRRHHAAAVMGPALASSPLGQWLLDLFCERDSADVDTIVAMYGALAEPDPDDLWSGIGVPTLVVSGSLDRSHQRALDLQPRIPGAQLAVIEGAGHTCNLERPWEFDAAVLRFLERAGLR